MRFNLVAAAALSLSFFAVATGAYAVAPTTLTSIPAGDVLITELTSPYTITASGQNTAGTIYSAVFSNTSGGLDFFYQFNVTSASSPVSQFTASDFTSFNTNLYQLNQVDIDGNTKPFTSGGVAATDAFVTSGTAYFTFGTTVNTGAQSNTLLVTTNAKLYTQNNGTVTGGAATNAPVLAPTIAPEAGTFTLAFPALGMIGAVVLRRRKK